MTDALLATELFLREQYSKLIGAKLIAGLAQLTSARDCACWQWQDADLKNVDSIGAASGGVVLDEEIGLCLYIQLYKPSTDLAGQLSRALAIRSELLPGRTLSPNDGDTSGEWRVAIHWLVDDVDLPSWIKKVAQLRQETAHFEEVPVDAIVAEDSDWAEAFRRHAIPRLLLQVRAALVHEGLDAARKWANADEIVRKALRAISSDSTDERMRPYVEQLMARLRDIDNVTPAPDPKSEVRHVFSIGLENFRNVKKLSLDLRAPGQSVAANVVHGPNGSGKSAVLEGLSLAVGSVSQRYIDYLQDGNISASDKPGTYVQQYLAPISAPTALPRLALNMDEAADIRIAVPTVAADASAQLSGSIYLTTANTSPLSRRASDLGAEIAGGYSIVALSTLEWIDSTIAQAEAKRDAFNRRIGLKPTTSRDHTARTRIAESRLVGALSISDQVLQWLRTAAGPLIGDSQRQVLSEWDSLVASQPSEIKHLVNCNSEEEIKNRVAAWLKRKNEVLLKIDLVLHRSQLAKSRMQENLPSDIIAWGEWLSKQSLRSSGTESDEIADLRKRLEIASVKLSEITKTGLVLRERLKHFSDIRNFLQAHWLPTHPETCPTCNTLFPNEQGSGRAIEAAEQATKVEIETRRQEYQIAQSELDSIKAELDKTGAMSPPIDVLPQLRLIFGSELDTNRLADEAFRRSLSEELAWIRRVPILSGNFLVEDKLKARVEQTSQEIWEAYVEQSEVFESPECWKKLRSQVLSAFTSAVREHLPRRLQALWLELNANITPAPWQYPGPVEIDVEPRRGQTEARVVVRGADVSPLATHILNSAEVHSLAIAWFLTRYLTWGRFHLSLLALDDPAQQMDQPTFRDLCRLLESLVRLHRIKNKQLTLIVFLHQDERALDAARAMNAKLHFLRWNNGAEVFAQTKLMRTESLLPRKPYAIIQSK